ncbi:MAG: lysophospholipid acyltransferase family protein [Desulforegulaceae bacterium]|nr:lysophospholipid acyltransferase family protein [Desulforegulaceae bacterium]
MQKLQTIIINMIANFLSFIPKSTGRYLGIFFGKIWFAFGKKRRFIAIHNLKKIYSDKMSPVEIKKLARKNFIFHSITTFEILRLKRLSKSQIINEIEKVEGFENYLKAKKSNRPIFLLSAHFGNWELMALSAPLILHQPIHLIARKLDFEPLDQLIKTIRRKTGNLVIDKKQSATMISQILRKKGVVGVLTDQRALGNSAVDASFMGHPSKTNKGIALFDLRYKPEIVPIFCYRLENGKYKLKFFPPLKRPLRSDFKKDLKTYTEIYNKVLGEKIYQTPEHWFWFHDRWEKKEDLFGKKEI